MPAIRRWPVKSDPASREIMEGHVSPGRHARRPGRYPRQATLGGSGRGMAVHEMIEPLGQHLVWADSGVDIREAVLEDLPILVPPNSSRR